jgi:hypothetical protein
MDIVRFEVFIVVTMKNAISLLVTANIVPTSLILFTLMIEVIHSYETSFLKEPYVITSQKTAFFRNGY